MLHRPTRRAHVRADADAPEPKKFFKNFFPKKGKHADRNLVLTTEFNYNYRVLDGVWASYVEKGAPPLPRRRAVSPSVRATPARRLRPSQCAGRRLAAWQDSTQEPRARTACRGRTTACRGARSPHQPRWQPMR